MLLRDSSFCIFVWKCYKSVIFVASICYNKINLILDLRRVIIGLLDVCYRVHHTKAAFTALLRLSLRNGNMLSLTGMFHSPWHLNPVKWTSGREVILQHQPVNLSLTSYGCHGFPFLLQFNCSPRVIKRVAGCTDPGLKSLYNSLMLPGEYRVTL